MCEMVLRLGFSTEEVSLKMLDKGKKHETSDIYSIE